MPAGFADPYASRRTMHDLCRWWRRDESQRVPPRELALRKEAEGSFYAREERVASHSDQIVESSFMVDRHSVTIRTNDDVSGISPEDAVEYDGDVWAVQSVQTQRLRRRSELSRHPQLSTFIELRR